MVKLTNDERCLTHNLHRAYGKKLEFRNNYENVFLNKLFTFKL